MINDVLKIIKFDNALAQNHCALINHNVSSILTHCKVYYDKNIVQIPLFENLTNAFS